MEFIQAFLNAQTSFSKLCVIVCQLPPFSKNQELNSEQIDFYERKLVSRYLCGEKHGYCVTI